jgi:hypothetical protein
MTEAERKAGITPETTTGANATIDTATKLAVGDGFTYRGLAIHGADGPLVTVTAKEKVTNLAAASEAYSNLMADVIWFMATVPQVRDALNRHGFRVIDHRKETT